MPQEARVSGPGCDHLFVYGSLRSDVPHATLPEEARAAASLLTAQADQVGRGRVSGALYAIDSYPGLVEAAGDLVSQVVGEVWRMFSPNSALLVALDSYEGESYSRVRMRVRMDDGREIEAWVYRYVAAPPPGNPAVALIASGDYLSWLMTRRA